MRASSWQTTLRHPVPHAHDLRPGAGLPCQNEGAPTAKARLRRPLTDAAHASLTAGLHLCSVSRAGRDAGAPDAEKVDPALVALSAALAAPLEAGGGAGPITTMGGVAAPDANGHTPPCEGMLGDPCGRPGRCATRPRLERTPRAFRRILSASPARAGCTRWSGVRGTDPQAAGPVRLRLSTRARNGSNASTVKSANAAPARNVHW